MSLVVVKLSNKRVEYRHLIKLSNFSTIKLQIFNSSSRTWSIYKYADHLPSLQCVQDRYATI